MFPLFQYTAIILFLLLSDETTEAVSKCPKWSNNSEKWNTEEVSTRPILSMMPNSQFEWTVHYATCYFNIKETQSKVVSLADGALQRDSLLLWVSTQRPALFCAPVPSFLPLSNLSPSLVILSVIHFQLLLLWGFLHIFVLLLFDLQLPLHGVPSFPPPFRISSFPSPSFLILPSLSLSFPPSILSFFPSPDFTPLNLFLWA